MMIRGQRRLLSRRRRYNHDYSLLLSIVLFLLSTVLLVVSAGDDDPPKMNFMPPNKKVCPPFKCPKKDEEPVMKWPLRLQSTGCQGMGGGGMSMFGGNAEPRNSPMETCCDVRHACLQTCGSPKSWCDDEFLACSKTACVTVVDPEAKKQCETSSSIHGLMVQMDQCDRYDTNQRAHCECVSSKTAGKRREQLLRNFYKKFSPEGIDKAAGLAAKADSASKFAGLLVKLYQKYPESVKKVKDPQQEMLEKLMKEHQEKKDKEEEEGGGASSSKGEETTTTDDDGNGDDDDDETEDLDEL